ncbi:MAG TPA: alkaline phosphatase family protein [Bryobacteraceae bacterium]|nr:alkaline phosphatase family protein [Bryobacteraceae bacterium]
MRSCLSIRKWLAPGVCFLFTWSTLAVPPALRAQATPTATTPIQHVVVIFDENISFDHYFGTYPNAANNNTTEPAFHAAPNTPTVNGLTGALLTNNPNSHNPFRLTRAQAVTCDQNHGYTPEQQAADGGLMDKFVQFTGSSSASCDIMGYGNNIVMGYYDGNTVTALWNYAQNYAMSDNSFSTNFGPSTVGAVNLISGNTSMATVTAGSAAGNVGSGGAVIGDPRPDPSLDDCTLPPPRTYIKMTGKNVGDLLNAANLTWGWFQGGFRPSSTSGGTAVCATAHNNVSGASAGADYVPHHEPFMYYQQTSNPHHLPPTSTAMIGQTDQANHQYDTADFFTALAAGNLPAVSYLKPPAYQDGHPGYSDPLDEQNFVVTAVNAIMKSPFWNSTAIFILYDDSDGWYDHVLPPIISQSATADDALTGPGSCGSASNPDAAASRCGYGPRQPLMLISPYAKVNYVDHTVTDQSSVLRFIEDNWNLGRIGNGSRDAVAGTLNNMFNFSNGGSTPALILDPNTGLPSSSGGGTTAGVTKAVANPKNAVTTSLTMTLDASSSTSYDGGSLSYQWTLGPGSPSATISGANTVNPTVTFPPGGLGTYTFVLTVTDSSGATSTDTTSITLVL